MTPFSEILGRAVAATPGAIGGAFAARDGETVDYVSNWDRTDWAIFTAHYGVLLKHVRSALHTFHFGDAQVLVITHADMDILVQSVDDDYYAILVVGRPRSLAAAMRSISEAAGELRREMS